MTIKALYPDTQPSLLLDFANTKALDPRITFARASTARFYDGKTVAKAEENLLLQSQDITTTWSIASATRVANDQTAPDGTSTADTITATAENAQHFVNQTITPPTGTVVFSVFAKAGTHPYIQLFFGTQTTSFANFDLTAGSGATGTSGNITSSSIVDAGNGWYRCVVVLTNTNISSAAIGLADTASAVRNPTWNAAGTETVFLWGAQLEQRSAVTAYTPTTTQPITNYVPVLQSAANNVARFDHSPTTGESLGLLIEEQRTNLFERSEEFDDAYWGKARGNVIPNTIVAPDGTLTGDKFFEDTQTGPHHINIASQSYTSGVAYTLSGFYKAGERPRVRLGLGNGGAPFPDSGNHAAIFDLLSGLIVFQGSSITRASITPVGNGWFRCSITATAQATGTDSGFVGFLLQAGSTAISYTGDGYSGLFYWGAQLEAGAFPTSYIPTVASQVTRSADAASMTGANFSSWYRADEGTLYAESRCPKGITGNLNRIVSLNDGTASNRMEIDTGTVATTVVRIQVNGVSQGSLAAGSFTDFQVRKSALGIQLDNFTLAANTATNSDTSALVTVVNRLMIGQSPAAASSFLNGTLAKIAYYPKRLADAELQALTT
jgi:hypothetical protein